MFSIKIDKKPIIVMANNRSGSGALTELLARNNALESFHEPTTIKDTMDRFTRCIDKGRTNFILKFMPHHMKYCDLYEKILAGDCYKIKLTRNNTVDQIKSFYISFMTDRWYNYEDNKEFTIGKNQKALRLSIENIIENDNFFDRTNIKFDAELTYESILDLIASETKSISPKPTNDKEIRDWVKAGLNVYMSKLSN